MKFIQSIISERIGTLTRESSRKYNPINNFSDHDSSGDDEQQKHFQPNYNNNEDDDDELMLYTNNINKNNNTSSLKEEEQDKIPRTTSQSSSRLDKSSSKPLTLRIKQHYQDHSNDYNTICPPFHSSLPSPPTNHKIQAFEKIQKLNKMSSHFELEHDTGGERGREDQIAELSRYSRMSHEEDASSIMQQGNQSKRKGKFQSLILGVRQCNPVAMFVALALLFIIVGAIAFFVLVLCILLIEAPEPVVILISIDAFRYDFVDKFRDYVPALDSLRKRGVIAGKLQPCFPTKTFPNHYSIATGQYVENHGMVSNSFYDRNAPFKNKLFKQTLVDTYWWSEGEPIWIAAEKQNVSTAIYDFPGSNVKIQGIYPSFYEPIYKKDPTIDRRIGKIEQYLKMKRDKVPGAPSLIMYYLNWVDDAAHHYGVPDSADSTSPDSLVFYNALNLTDSFIGSVMKMIDELGMKSSVNLIIVSDHGMLNLNPDKTVWIRTMLERYYNETQPANRVDFKSVVSSYTSGTLVDMNILVNSTDEVLRRNTIDQLYTDLQHTVQRYSLNCTIYKREEIPEGYHYSKNPRIPDILLVSDPGYYSGLDSSAWWGERGDHGYRNDVDEMYAFFAGIGPKLKSGGFKAYEVVKNIHIHSLIAELLKIKPSSKIDGNIENIKNVLSYELKKK